jgi:hypothetical protein
MRCKHVADESRSSGQAKPRPDAMPAENMTAPVLARLLHLFRSTTQRVDDASLDCDAEQRPRTSTTTMAQTTLDEWASSPVDPEIRAHVSSLITALGGIGDDGTYSLGDDALLCLKDLRKWIKFGQQKFNRRDVERCMGEANLVKGDLLEILAKISPRVMEDKWRHKIAVAARTYSPASNMDSADRCKSSSSSH